MQLADFVRRHELAIGGGAAFALAGSSMAVNRHCIPVHPTSRAGAVHRRQEAVEVQDAGDRLQAADADAGAAVALLLRRGHRLSYDGRSHLHRSPGCMRYTEPRPYADPENAARRIVEIASIVEAVQDGRIYIELINGPFLFKDKGSPAEYGAGMKLALERGWLKRKGA